MRKSADVVILMQPSSSYTLLYPKEIIEDKLVLSQPDVPFSYAVIEYLNALSVALLKDSESRLYSDVITFAFFCRKANLLKLKDKYDNTENLRLGRGILFHIAPSNVPINFGYSLVSGLLAGNTNIVRVSSKQFSQVDLIIKHLHKLKECGQYADVADRTILVRYDRTSDATAYFSSLANVRIIWGGDATISTIRQYSIPPRSFDVCFADRYSIAVINPIAIIKATNQEIARLAESFYNDTYLFDQNACSAPHLIFWTKSVEIEKAKSIFWTAVHTVVEKKYQFQPVMSIDKLTAFYKQSISVGIKAERMPDNLIVRADLEQLPKNIDEFRCACGYFSEYTIDTLDEISSIVTEKYQTLAYYGFEQNQLIDFVRSNRLHGLDRIVPFGETTTFDLTWDGYNLINSFTRVVSVL